jgi:hypothetical protein
MIEKKIKISFLLIISSINWYSQSDLEIDRYILIDMHILLVFCIGLLLYLIYA